MERKNQRTRKDEIRTRKKFLAAGKACVAIFRPTQVLLITTSELVLKIDNQTRKKFLAAGKACVAIF